MKYSQNGLPYHIGVSADQIGRYVLLPGDPKRVKKIAAHLDDPVKQETAGNTKPGPDLWKACRSP